MTKREQFPDVLELERLADYLSREQKSILNRWRDKITAEEKQTSALASWSQEKFYDDIPDFLNQLCHGLCNRNGKVDKFARKHGAHRWEHGMDLRQLVYEWRILHEVIMDTIEQFQMDESISQESLSEAFRRLTGTIHEGIQLSIEEYYRLLQLKANTRVRGLEQMIQEHGKVAEVRGQNLQQASHDMKGSMTAIRMNLNLLEHADLDDRTGGLVKNLKSAADGLNDLLHNLLNLSRLEAGHDKVEVEEFNVAESMRDLCDSLQTLAEAEHLELKCSGPDDLNVRSDQLKVRRIAQNLLLNSLKYTPNGYVELQWKPMQGDQWQLIVRDTGPGIDETNAAPFLVTQKVHSKSEKPASTGVSDEFEEIQSHSEGIGLLIVRQLCQLMDAVVEVESERGKGTTFRIIFPAHYRYDGEGGKS